MSKRFFSFAPDDGIVWFDTREEAKARAERELAACRADAEFEGEWPEDVKFVQWGEVIERAAEVPANHSFDSVDYELRPTNAAVTRRA